MDPSRTCCTALEGVCLTIGILTGIGSEKGACLPVLDSKGRLRPRGDIWGISFSTTSTSLSHKCSGRNVSRLARMDILTRISKVKGQT